MFLNLAHKKLEVYPIVRNLIAVVYKITAAFPTHERYGLGSQMQRSAVSILLNIAEGSARKSPSDRNRLYVIARASLVELDASLEIADGLGYIEPESSTELKPLIVESFKKISLLIKATNDSIHKE